MRRSAVLCVAAAAAALLLLLLAVCAPVATLAQNASSSTGAAGPFPSNGTASASNTTRLLTASFRVASLQGGGMELPLTPAFHPAVLQYWINVPAGVSTLEYSALWLAGTVQAHFRSNTSTPVSGYNHIALGTEVGPLPFVLTKLNTDGHSVHYEFMLMRQTPSPSSTGGAEGGSFITRQISLNGLFNTPNGTFEVSLANQYSFCPSMRTYSLYVSHVVTHLQVIVEFGGGVGSLWMDGQNAPVTIMSDVKAPWIELLHGTNTLLFNHSADAGGLYTFTITRAPPPANQTASPSSSTGGAAVVSSTGGVPAPAPAPATTWLEVRGQLESGGVLTWWRLLGPADFHFDVRAYNLSVGFNVLFVDFYATYWSGSGSVQLLPGGVEMSVPYLDFTPRMPLRVGQSALIYNHSADGQYTFTITRAPWASVCGSRARLIESNCPGANFSARVFPTQCDVGCAATWFNDSAFYTDCVVTSGMAVGLYRACEAQRPLQHFYPHNYYGYNCSWLEAHATQQCGMGQTIDAMSLVHALPCSAQCSQPWLEYARSCLPTVPPAHRLTVHISALSGSCQSAASESSLAGTYPRVTYWSTGDTLHFDWVPLAGVVTWTVEWSRNATAAGPWNVACSTPWAGVTGCGGYFVPPFEPLYFRAWASNKVSRSDYSPLFFVPLVPGTRHPAPPSVSCLLNGTDVYAHWTKPNWWSSRMPEQESFAVMAYRNTSDHADLYRAPSLDMEPWTEPRIWGMLHTDQMVINARVAPDQRWFVGARLAPADGSSLFLYVRAINRCRSNCLSSSSRFDGHISTGVRCAQIAPNTPLSPVPAVGTLMALSLTAGLNGSAIIDSSLVSASFAMELALRIVMADTVARRYNASVQIAYYPHAPLLTANQTRQSTSVQLLTGRLVLYNFIPVEACHPLCSGPHVIYTRIVYDYRVYLAGAQVAAITRTGIFNVSSVRLQRIGDDSTTDVQLSAPQIREAAQANRDPIANSWQLDVQNYFVQYANRSCVAREQKVNALCGINVRQSFYPYQCSSWCAAEFGPFYRECVANSTAAFDPSPFYPLAGFGEIAAASFHSLCASNVPLDSYYPPPSAAINCSAVETTIVRACALASISSYAWFQSCPASCATAYVDFASRCLFAVPPSNFNYYPQLAFLNACRANMPSLPTSASLVSGFLLGDGRIIHVRWLMTKGSALQFALNMSTNGGPSLRIYTGPELSFIVTGLAYGSRYSFVVQAFNQMGAGPLSQPFESVPRPIVPWQPHSLLLVSSSVGPDSFRITWQAPQSQPMVETVAFAPCIAEVAAAAGTNTSSVVCAIVGRVNSTQLSYEFRFLRPNTHYVASVATVSVVGTNSLFATPFVSVRTTAMTPAVPPPPFIVSVTANAVVLSLPQYADMSNSVNAFELTLMPQAPLIGRNVTIVVSRSAGYANFSGLVPGGSYSLTSVALATSTGLRSAPSAPISFSMRAVLPGVVDSFGVSEVGTSSFRLSWSAPLSDGGSPIRSYGLRISSPIDGAPSPRFIDLGLALSYVLTGLQPGAAYNLVLTASNSIGPGVPLIVPPVLLPYSSPSIVSAVAMAAPGALGSAFGPGSRVVLRLDAPVNVSLLASNKAADWLSFTPAVSCPFTGVFVFDNDAGVNVATLLYATSNLVLTFSAPANGGGCTGPVIGSSIVTLLRTAHIVAGGAQGPSSISAPSASISPPLSGRWGESVKFLSVHAEVARVDQGATVPLWTLFGIGGNFSALAAEVSVRITASIGSISPASAASYSGAARAYPFLEATFTMPDFTAGQYVLLRVEILQGGNVIDSAVVAIVSAVTNHPIVLQAPLNVTAAPGISTPLLGLRLTDLDTRLNGNATATLVLSARNGNAAAMLVLLDLPASASAVMVTPGLRVESVVLYLSGPVAQLDALLQSTVGLLQFRFAVNSLADASLISVLADDGANGAPDASFPSRAWATIAVHVDCALAPAPKLESARLTDTLNAIVLEFDSSFLLTLPARSRDCLSMLSNATVATLGQGAVCAPMTATSFMVRLGNGNTVAPGQDVELRANTVSKCAASTTFAAGSVPLDPTANPALPVVALWAAQVIAPCDALVVQSHTTNTRLQTPTLTWSVSGSDGRPIDVSAQTGSTLTVGAELLQPGLTYTVTARARTAMGLSSEPASATVTMTDVAIASARITGDAMRVLPRGAVADLYPLIVQASLPACLNPAHKRLTYNWTASPAPSSPLVYSPSVTKLGLMLSTLADEVDYTFTLTVRSVFGAPDSGVSTSVRIRMQSAPLVAQAQFSALRVVSVLDEVVSAVTIMDASQSAEELVCAWTCVDENGNACTSQGQLLPSSNKQRMVIEPGTLASGLYSFTFVATKGARSSTPLHFQLSVVPTSPPRIALACPASPLSPDSPLSISSTVRRRAENSTVTYAWATWAAGFGPVAQLSGSAQADFVANQAQSAGFWRQGVTYSITLTVRESFGASVQWAEATCLVPVLSVPSGGAFECQPRNGAALRTPFRLTAPQWQSAAFGPLSYTFYRVGAGGEQVALSPVLQEPSLRVTLPPSFSADRIVTIGVRVTDSLGGSATSELTVSVNNPGGDVPLTAADLGAALEEGLSVSVNTGAVDDTVNAVAAVATAANTQQVGAEQVVQINATAASALNDRLVAAVQSVSGAVTVGQLVGTLGAIAQQPDTLSTQSAMGVVAMLAAGLQQVAKAHENDQSGHGSAGAARSAASSTALSEGDAQTARNVLGTVAQSATKKNDKTPASRRLLAVSDSTTDRTTVLAAYDSLRALLSLQSNIRLDHPGSVWTSTAADSSHGAAVARFSTAATVLLPISGGGADDSVTARSSLTAESVQTMVDARIITTGPNPFAWAAAAGQTVLGQAVTVEVTDSAGVALVSPAGPLTALADYSYIVRQAYDAAACPTATCAPSCRLYDPTSLSWSAVGITTAVDAASATVICDSATPGTVALLAVAPAADSSSGPDSSSSSSSSSTGAVLSAGGSSSHDNTQLLIIGISCAIGGVLLLLVIGVGVAHYRRQHRVQHAPTKSGDSEVELKRIGVHSTSWVSNAYPTIQADPHRPRNAQTHAQQPNAAANVLIDAAAANVLV